MSTHRVLAFAILVVLSGTAICRTDGAVTKPQEVLEEATTMRILAEKEELAEYKALEGVEKVLKSAESIANVKKMKSVEEPVLPPGKNVSIVENTIPVDGNTNLHNHELDKWVAPFEIQRSFPYYLAGHDEERRPIWIAAMGKYNIRRIISQGGPLVAALDKYADQAIHFCEKSMEDASTPDNKVDEVIFICDFDDLDMAQVTHLETVQFIISVVRRHRDFMNRHLHVALAINSNYAATVLVGLVRPILGNVMERVEVYGTNKDRWLPHLLKYCPRSQIPEWYGGYKGFKAVKFFG